MKGNLKVLLLALVAALALSAMTASAAFGTAKFTTVSGEYPSVAIGEQESSLHTLSYFEATPGEKIGCKVAKYEGTLTEASTNLTITPHYRECQATGALTVNATVDLNGCDFLFEALTNTSATDTHGAAKVVCPAGQKITVTAATCSVHVFPQTIKKGITYTNLANGQVTVDVDVTNEIHYEDTDGFLCPFSGNTTGTNGNFVSSVLVKGFKDEGSVADPNTSGQVDYKPGVERKIHVK